MGPLEEPARPVPHKPVTARLLVASAGGPGPRAEWGWVCGAWHSSGTLEHVASYPSSEALYSLRGHVPQKYALKVWPKSIEQTRWRLKGQLPCGSCFHTQTFVLNLPGIFLPGVALSMWLTRQRGQFKSGPKKKKYIASQTQEIMFYPSP